MRWRIGLLWVLVLGLTIATVSGSEQDFDDEVAAVVEEELEELESEVSIEDEEIQNYVSPVAEQDKFYFAEHFDNKEDFAKNWIKSKAMKDDTAEEIAKYDGEWSIESPKKQVWRNDFGLVLKSKAKHAAIASKLSRPFVFNNKPFVVQYEVTMQDGQDCGGSYIKLLSQGKDTDDLTKFNDKTPYTIMFGPDKCGNDVKLHFIFRHKNPLNGSISEKHCRKPKERSDEPFKDKLPHLYQLVVNPDNTFQIRVDHRVLNEGSLLKDFTPPVNPPKEIDDPTDKKPENWDEREKIPDPDSTKPEDWDEDAPPQIPDPSAVKPDGWLDDEPEMFPDPNAKKPEDWDTEIDGEWEPPLIENPVCEKVVGCGPWKAPLITNPEYKGKWRAPLIDNPNYQGKWAPRKIPNPDFFEDFDPFKMTAISAVGFELWSMSSDILFDNLLITDDIALADEWAAVTFDLKRKQIDKESESFLAKIIKLTNENPWLWGVYIVVVGTPLTFALYTLCCASKEKDAAAKAKKTDEPSPDDEPTSEEPIKTEKQSEEQAEEDAESKKEDTSPRSKKSDLEVENNEEEGKKPETEEEEEEEETGEPESQIEEIGNEGSPSQNTDGARKRKSRKE